MELMVSPPQAASLVETLIVREQGQKGHGVYILTILDKLVYENTGCDFERTPQNL